MTKSLVGPPIWVMLLAAGVLLPHAITAGEIHDAVRSGDASAVKALLDKSPALVNAKNESGQTPLHLAAEGRNPALVLLLVERGADVNAADNRGISPLHPLASRGNLDTMALLVDKGANVNLKASDGSAPLESAVLGRQVEAVRLLVSRKANLETPLPATATTVKDVPIWNFHGTADDVEPVATSRAMIEAIRKAGGHPRHTEYEGIGHNVFMWAYTEPALVEWLFAQKRAAGANPK